MPAALFISEFLTEEGKFIAALTDAVDADDDAELRFLLLAQIYGRLLITFSEKIFSNTFSG